MPAKVLFIADNALFSPIHQHIDHFLKENQNNILALVNANPSCQNLAADFHHGYKSFNGSTFYTLKNLYDTFQPTYGDSIFFFSETLGDMDSNNAELGKNYQQFLAAEHYFLQIEDNDIKVEDPTGLIILCWQMMRLAANTSELIEFEFHDIESERLILLKDTFSTNTQFIPKDCKMTFYEYNATDLHPIHEAQQQDLLLIESEIKSHLTNFSISTPEFEEILNKALALSPSQKELHRRVLIEKGLVDYATFLGAHLNHLNHFVGK